MAKQPFVVPLDEDVNWSHAHYMLEKLSRAVQKLAVGEGDVRSRLRDASVEIFSLSPSMLPVSCGIRDRVIWAQRTLTGLDPPPYNAELPPDERETRLQTTLRRMKNRTAAKVAVALVEAQLELASLCRHQDEGHFLPSPSK